MVVRILLYSVLVHYYSSTRTSITIKVLEYTRMCVCVCVCACVPEAQGTCDVLPIAQVFPGSNAVTHLRHSPLAWCIACWAQIFAASGRHINHIATRPQSPHTHTTQSTLTSDSTATHSHAVTRQGANTIAQWKNKKFTLWKFHKVKPNAVI